jgi:hypothetical protein
MNHTNNNNNRDGKIEILEEEKAMTGDIDYDININDYRRK